MNRRLVSRRRALRPRRGMGRVMAEWWDVLKVDKGADEAEIRIAYTRAWSSVGDSNPELHDNRVRMSNGTYMQLVDELRKIDIAYHESLKTRKVEIKMPYYRKRPVVIEAQQFTTNNEIGSPQMDQLVNWMNQGQGKRVAWHNGTDIYINTLEGDLRASCGDWIIKGVKGEFYPCKPDIFEATYELFSETHPMDDI